MRGQKYLRDGLVDMIRYLQKNNVNNVNMIEIGSYAGESAEIFLQSNFVKKIYCIDPWQDITNLTEGNNYTKMDIVEKKFDLMSSKYPNCIKCKGILTDFIDSINEQVDFVYIDAIHSYEACKHDIIEVMSLIKPKYAIGGHDYCKCSKVDFGVIQAVKEIFRKPDMKFQDTSWIKLLK